MPSFQPGLTFLWFGLFSSFHFPAPSPLLAGDSVSLGIWLFESSVGPGIYPFFELFLLYRSSRGPPFFLLFQSHYQGFPMVHVLTVSALFKEKESVPLTFLLLFHPAAFPFPLPQDATSCLAFPCLRFRAFLSSPPFIGQWTVSL